MKQSNNNSLVIHFLMIFCRNNCQTFLNQFDFAFCFILKTSDSMEQTFIHIIDPVNFWFRNLIFKIWTFELCFKKNLLSQEVSYCSWFRLSHAYYTETIRLKSVWTNNLIKQSKCNVQHFICIKIELTLNCNYEKKSFFDITRNCRFCKKKINVTKIVSARKKQGQ